MAENREHPQAIALLRLQTWLSPAFPIGSYSYSHGLEQAIEVGYVRERRTLVDWLEADLLHGSMRNDAIFFAQAWQYTIANDQTGLFDVAELAAAYRGTAEFALESFQQAAACLATLCSVWPDQMLDWFAAVLRDTGVRPTLATVLAIRLAVQGVPLRSSLAAFLQSCIANLVSAGVRLIPLGQTDGQVAIAELEGAILAASAYASKANLEDLGSAAISVDLASMRHETQYTRLFRS